MEWAVNKTKLNRAISNVKSKLTEVRELTVQEIMDEYIKLGGLVDFSKKSSTKEVVTPKDSPSILITEEVIQIPQAADKKQKTNNIA